MARTERATSPAAQKRDRSLNRSGLDPNPRKHGAGPHNWGALEQEAGLPPPRGEEYRPQWGVPPPQAASFWAGQGESWEDAQRRETMHLHASMHVLDAPWTPAPARPRREEPPPRGPATAAHGTSAPPPPGPSFVENTRAVLTVLSVAFLQLQASA